MTCEPCAIRANGDTTSADATEALRSQRLLLAYLTDDNDTFTDLAAGVRECRDCMGRLVAMYLAAQANSLVHISGSREAAAMATEMAINDLLTGHIAPEDGSQ